ncbi:tripartite tricarboxylate transporter TctB family protein [Nocardioides alcanivorans]|uniref:tripartite tricarboxylate transporter TctB family protein n=1 Tax=Nocardioides alcanivorans TaxID=2897352 RepID=UPI001F28E352|nr:tripartite tricarboxylate transporter TctB family protein [Nocardioides alcanivorans]
MTTSPSNTPVAGPSDQAGHGVRVVDLITSCVLLASGVAFVIAARKEGIGSMDAPESGFFPLVVGVVLVLASLGSVFEDLRNSATQLSDEDEEFGGSANWSRVIGVVAVAAVVAALASITGFITGISIGLFAMAKVAGVTGWRRPLILAVSFGVVSWLVFVYWLFIPLPVGLFGTV